MEKQALYPAYFQFSFSQPREEVRESERNEGTGLRPGERRWPKEKWPLFEPRPRRGELAILIGAKRGRSVPEW